MRSGFVKRGLSLPDVGIGLLNKKNQVVSLPSTALPLMANVNVDDVVAENASGSAVELSSHDWNAYEELRIAMKSVGMVYDLPFQMLVHSVEQASEDISEDVCCDLPRTV